MNSGRYWLAGALATLAVGARADEPPGIEHNPFTRPAIFEPASMMSEAAAEAGSASGALALRITMISSQHRLAKVGDRILAPGDEVQGYRLVRVYENRAVFERQGDELTVYVKPHLEEPDARFDD